jgi:asparagine synthase (glutamine-hydrolysing)
VSEIFSTQARPDPAGLYRSEFVEHMLQNPEVEMSPKGHSRLWQVALLEAWMQAHAI